MKFDVSTGEFHLHTPICSEVSLLGEGRKAIAIKRALQRSGFVVVSDKNSLFCIQVTVAIEQVFWQVTYNSTMSDYNSVYELIRFLNKVAPPVR